MTTNQTSRKKLLIYKSIQIEMFKIVFWSNFLTAAIVSAASIGFIMTIENLAHENIELGFLSQITDIIFQYSWIYFIYLLVGLIFSIALVFYVWLKMSNAIAGPLYKIKTVLENYVSQGKFETIRLRKTDKIHEIADLINQSIEKSNSK